VLIEQEKLIQCIGKFIVTDEHGNKHLQAFSFFNYNKKTIFTIYDKFMHVLLMVQIRSSRAKSLMKSALLQNTLSSFSRK